MLGNHQWNLGSGTAKLEDRRWNLGSGTADSVKSLKASWSALLLYSSAWILGLEA